MENGFKETEIGLIPTDWGLKRLSEIANIRYGKQKPKSEGQYPVIGSSGVYAYSLDPLIDFATLVIGRKGNAGTVQLALDPCWPADTTFYLEWLTKEINVQFLYHFMSAHKLSGEHAKTTLPSIQRQDLENYLFPAPDSNEQSKIVILMNEIQQAIARQEQIIAKSKELKRSLMHRLFTYGLRGEDVQETEIGLMPESWQPKRVKDVCKKPQYGFTETASDKEIGPKFLRITDITDKGVDWDTVPYCKCPSDKIEKYKLCKGDILFARIGATTGKSFIIAECPLSVYASYLIRVRTIESVIPLFLYYFFQSEGYWKQINANKGSSLKQGVNGSILADMIVPMPLNKEEQEEISKILKIVDKKIERAHLRHNKLSNFFKSMLQLLMTGQVRVKDIDFGEIHV